MKTPVLWHDNCRGSWCHAIVSWLTVDCIHVIDKHQLLGFTEPVVVVLKADMVTTKPAIERLNETLSKLKHGILLIITANEEGAFDPSAVSDHNKMRIWIQTPTINQQQWCSAAIPWGWTPGFDGTRWQSRLPGYEAVEADRMLAYSFVGQNTHDRRHQCVNALEEQCASWPNSVLTSHGFSRGLPKHLYFELLMNSKLVICPSGPRTVDTFRVWEALECGAVPIVDGRSARDIGQDYWNFVAGPDHPLIVVNEWDWETEAAIDGALAQWKVLQPLTLKWWAGRKEFWQRKFRTDLEMLNVR